MNKRNVIENLKQFDLFADLSEKKITKLNGVCLLANL